MAEFTGNFETGSNAAQILASDPGSNTVWNDVSRGAGDGGNSPTYASSPAYGTLSAKVTSVAGDDGGYFAWTAAILGSLTTHYGRMYVYLPSTTATYLAFGFNALSTLAWRILVNGTFSIRDSTGTDVAVGAVTPSINQWIRFEWKIVSDVATGLAEFKLFNDANSVSPVETQTSGNCNTLTETSLVRFGNPGLSPAASTWYFDNMLINDTGYAGPAAGTVPVQVLSMQSHVFGHNMW